MELLNAQLELLAQGMEGHDLWMPAFNRDFLRRGSFDLSADASQVGVLSEHFRTSIAQWRTWTPAFSFSGVGTQPRCASQPEIDPFGAESDFSQLVERDGVVLFYGAPFSSVTLLHHAERISGTLVYRYDKRFKGRVFFPDGHTVSTSLLYHVRPMGMRMEYDWSRLLPDALNAGVCKTSKSNHASLIAASARRLVSFWAQRLHEDPFYLLDTQTVSWVQPKVEALGRRFEIGDFESVGETSVSQLSEPTPNSNTKGPG
jgi:aminoglycoside N3'-acetyltransferase